MSREAYLEGVELDMLAYKILVTYMLPGGEDWESIWTGIQQAVHLEWLNMLRKL